MKPPRKHWFQSIFPLTKIALWVPRVSMTRNKNGSMTPLFGVMTLFFKGHGDFSGSKFVSREALGPARGSPARRGPPGKPNRRDPGLASLFYHDQSHHVQWWVKGKQPHFPTLITQGCPSFHRGVCSFGRGKSETLSCEVYKSLCVNEEPCLRRPWCLRKRKAAVWAPTFLSGQ